MNLGGRLGQLSIEYSNERNAIIHGTSIDLDTDWKWLELMGACLDIISVFEELEGWDQEEEFMFKENKLPIDIYSTTNVNLPVRDEVGKSSSRSARALDY